MGTFTRRSLLGGVAAGMAGLALPGCSSGQASTPAAALNLKIGVQASFSSLNPLQNLGYQFTQMVAYTMYDPLLEFVKDGSHLKPVIAESWDVTDPKKIDFKIRKGVKFHDGTPLTVKDVAYSIKLRCDPVAGGKAQSSMLMDDTQFGSIEIIGDDVVRINVKQRVQVALLGRNIFAIPDEALSKHNLNTDEVGTGPYKLNKFISGNSLAVDAVPDYWGGASNLKELRFDLFKDLATETAALRAKTIDAIYDVKPIDVASVKAIPGFESVEQGQYYLIWLPQLATGPLSNLAARKALRYCLDVEQLLKVAMPDGKVMYDLLNTTEYGLNLPVDQRYDPAFAKAELAKAGLTNVEIPIHVATTYRDAFQQAQVLQQGFQAAGITSEIKTYQISDYIANVLLKRNWDGIAFNAGTIPFPYNSLLSAAAVTLTKENAKQEVDKKVLAVAEEAGSLLPDDPKIKPLFDEIQKLNQDSAGIMAAFIAPSTSFLPKGRSGLRVSGFGDVRWTDVK